MFIGFIHPGIKSPTKSCTAESWWDVLQHHRPGVFGPKSPACWSVLVAAGSVFLLVLFSQLSGLLHQIHQRGEHGDVAWLETHLLDLRRRDKHTSNDSTTVALYFRFFISFDLIYDNLYFLGALPSIYCYCHCMFLIVIVSFCDPSQGQLMQINWKLTWMWFLLNFTLSLQK